MCSKSEMEFSIFLIHQMAEFWHKTPSEVYSILDSSNILDNYIIKHYDVLHSMGSESLIEDLNDYIKEKHIIC